MNMCKNESQNTTVTDSERDTTQNKEFASPVIKHLKSNKMPSISKPRINDLVFGAAVIKEEDEGTVLSESVAAISQNLMSRDSNQKSDKSQVSKDRSPLKLDQFENSSISDSDSEGDNEDVKQYKCTLRKDSLEKVRESCVKGLIIKDNQVVKREETSGFTLNTDSDLKGSSADEENSVSDKSDQYSMPIAANVIKKDRRNTLMTPNVMSFAKHNSLAESLEKSGEKEKET